MWGIPRRHTRGHTWDFWYPRSLQVHSKIISSITTEEFLTYLPPTHYTESRAALRHICLPLKIFHMGCSWRHTAKKTQKQTALPDDSNFIGLASVFTLHGLHFSHCTKPQVQAWSPANVCPYKHAPASILKQLSQPLDFWVFQNWREAAASRPQNGTKLYSCWSYEHTVGFFL